MLRVSSSPTRCFSTGTRSASWLLLSVLSLCAPSAAFAVEPSTDHDFVIVGAGVAGLYAAFELDQLGYDVLILEATGRHGGRVFSDSLGDVDIERGAEELYGTTNNFIFNDIKNLYGNGAQTTIFNETAAEDTLYQIDTTETCFVESGDCYLDSEIYDYWDFYYDAPTHGSDPTDITVGVHMDTVLGVDSSHRTYHLYEAGVPAGEFGTTVERLGLRSLSRQDGIWTLSGDVYGFASTGYEDALNALYFDTIAPSKVSYFSPVVTIDTSGPKPVAIDAGGTYHYAKAILVTVSVGVLQEESIDFIPNLPAAKVTAYNTIGMGRGGKISLRFSTQFWENKMFSLLAEGPAASCWTPGAYQPASSDNVLTCFSMGENWQILTDLADDTARINRVLSDLDEIFSGAATANYIEGNVQDWTAHPYVLGSYSYPAPGTYPGGTSMREELAMQVGTTLYFAGEATHNTASATVPGAMQSGERAAGEMDTDEGGPPAAGTPTADFSANILSGGAPLDVDFTDLSNQTPTGWSWTFGDTGTSGVQHASHQYTTPGTYTVSLMATNANGSHTIVMPNLITVSAGAVCGNSIVEGGETCDDGNTVGGDGCSATCDIEVCGNGVVDVGEGCDDGNTVAGDGCSEVCVVEFCSDGTLQVGLGEQCDDGNLVSEDGCSATCQDEFCGDTVLQVGLGEECDDGNTVSGDGCSDMCVVEPAPSAEFTADVTSGNAALLVTFSDLSTDGPTSWLWDFGDMGATSMDQNPAYNYTDAGTYTVSLTATNGSGFDVEVKTDYIVVPEPAALIQLGAGIFLLIGLNNRRRKGDRGFCSQSMRGERPEKSCPPSRPFAPCSTAAC